jgi:hypothetical protein
MSDQQDAAKLAGEWTKQLGLWASGTIVLSLTFLKDFVKDTPISTFWQAWLVVTWLILIVSLLFGHLAFGAPLTGAGRNTNWELKVNQETRLLSILQLSFFLLGLAGMVIFAASHFTDGSHSKAAPSALMWQRIGCVGPFAVGIADHILAIPDGTAVEECTTPNQIVDSIKKTCTNPATCLIVLVGSADRTPLQMRLEKQFGANDGLAKARADWVLDQIASGLALTRRNFLVLTSGPSKHGSRLSGEELQSDRSVSVLAIRAQVSGLDTAP